MASSSTRKLKPGDKAVLKLTVEQADLIVEQTFIDDAILAVIHAARVRDGVVAIRCTLDDLEELAGYVAAEANDTKDKKLRQKLDEISDEIDRVNLSYIDDSAPSAPAAPPRLAIVKK